MNSCVCALERLKTDLVASVYDFSAEYSVLPCLTDAIPLVVRIRFFNAFIRRDSERRGLMSDSKIRSCT